MSNRRMSEGLGDHLRDSIKEIADRNPSPSSSMRSPIDDLIDWLERRFDCYQGDMIAYHTIEGGKNRGAYPYCVISVKVGLPFDMAEHICCRVIAHMLEKWAGTKDRLTLFWRYPEKVRMVHESHRAGPQYSGEEVYEISGVGSHDTLKLSVRCVIISAKGSPPPSDGIRLEGISTELLKDIGGINGEVPWEVE